MKAAVSRPIVRYHGGKWELAAWIIAQFPKHRIYCEPYSGGASVLLQKQRSWAEVYNDLDGEMVNLFKVARDNGTELLHAITTTPFSRTEYFAAFETNDDPIEQARRTVIRSHMGFAGSATHGNVTGFRSFSANSGSHPASQWRSLPTHLNAIIARLRGVVIENRDAIDVISQQDTKRTLFYVDPPYIPETRDRGKDYRHEMTLEQHSAMLDALRAAKGMVVLSGYPCEMYDTALTGWSRIERKALAEGARERTEVLWLNPACERNKEQKSLFREAV